MSNWRRLLIVLMGLALLPGGLGAGDFDSQQAQHLAVDPGLDDDCVPSPIETVGVNVGSGTAHVMETTVQNTQSTPVNAYLYGRVEAGGRSVHFYSPITLAAAETATYKVDFEVTISVIAGLEVCENKPGGISDAPDPILIVAERESDDDDDGHGNGQS